MEKWVSRFWRDQNGQDLIEYTLILAIFALMTLALVNGEAPAVNTIWTTMNSHLGQGGTVAAGG